MSQPPNDETVRCPTCGKRHDTSTRTPGSLFDCDCGTPIRVSAASACDIEDDEGLTLVEDIEPYLVQEDDAPPTADVRPQVPTDEGTPEEDDVLEIVELDEYAVAGEGYPVAGEGEGKSPDGQYGVAEESATVPGTRTAEPAAPGADAGAIPLAGTDARRGCVNHPGKPPAAACARCKVLICEVCDFPGPQGTHLCPTCAMRAVGSSAEAAVAADTHRAQTMCREHPAVPAVARCSRCGAPVCEVCDHRFPDAIRLCPKCSKRRTRPISKSRKRLRAGAFLAALWVTAGLVFLLPEDLARVGLEQPLDDLHAAMANANIPRPDQWLIGRVGETGAYLLIGAVLMVPVIIGVGLSVGMLDRRAGNKLSLWIVAGWNIVLFLACLALPIIRFIDLR